MLMALQYFSLSLITNHAWRIFLLLTASLRSSNDCPDGWCLLTKLECHGLAGVMSLQRLRIQSFSDKASQSNIILVNTEAQLFLALNVGTEDFVIILMVTQYRLLCHRYMIIPTWLELPDGARYGDACKKYVRIGLWKVCSKSQGS